MRRYPALWQTWQSSQPTSAGTLSRPSRNFRYLNVGVQPEGKYWRSSSMRLADVRLDAGADLTHSARSLSVVPYCELAVVVPVYNEGGDITRTLKALAGFTQTHPTYRFILVDDGSTDGTFQMIRHHLHQFPNSAIHLVSYPHNRGKGYAVHQGIQCSQSDYVCFLDSDLAYSLDHLEGLLQRLQTCDVVIGCRSLGHYQPQRIKFWRRLSGKVFNLLSRWILNLEFRDMQAGLKGFNRQAAQVIFARQTLTGFSFDVELIYLAKKYGYRIGEIPAQVSAHHADKRSKVNLLKDSLRMLGDLLKIRYRDWRGFYD